MLSFPLEELMVFYWAFIDSIDNTLTVVFGVLPEQTKYYSLK
jgi:hypothetical protein